jgi:hypothetical protein
VAETVADRFYANATLQQPHRKRMPEAVGGIVLIQKPNPASRLVEDAAHGLVLYSSGRITRA